MITENYRIRALLQRRRENFDLSHVFPPPMRNIR